MVNFNSAKINLILVTLLDWIENYEIPEDSRSDMIILAEKIESNKGDLNSQLAAIYEVIEAKEDLSDFSDYWAYIKEYVEVKDSTTICYINDCMRIKRIKISIDYQIQAIMPPDESNKGVVLANAKPEYKEELKKVINSFGYVPAIKPL